MRVDTSLGKLLESDPTGEDGQPLGETGREGGTDLMDVINEKNSDDVENAGTDEPKAEDCEEGADQANEEAEDPDAGEGPPDELDRASENAEVQDAME